MDRKEIACAVCGAFNCYAHLTFEERRELVRERIRSEELKLSLGLGLQAKIDMAHREIQALDLEEKTGKHHCVCHLVPEEEYKKMHKPR